MERYDSTGFCEFSVSKVCSICCEEIFCFSGKRSGKVGLFSFSLLFSNFSISVYSDRFWT